MSSICGIKTTEIVCGALNSAQAFWLGSSYVSRSQKEKFACSADLMPC